MNAIGRFIMLISGLIMAPFVGTFIVLKAVIEEYISPSNE